jgi:hypothetical protein
MVAKYIATSVLSRASHKSLIIKTFSTTTALSLISSSCSASLYVCICWMRQNNLESLVIMNKHVTKRTV